VPRHNGDVAGRRLEETAPRAWADVSDYVRSLDLDAYLVGGAVRDELLNRPHKDQDFVVPGVDTEQLRAQLAPHGRVEDLEVAGQRVGLRLYPRDRGARALAPAGIEFAPPRAERSTGPGRHDFAIVADASLPLEEDMRRRDFTINAMARSLATGELVDPFGGRRDLERRILRTVSPTSFRDDPLRIVRGLRLISQLDLDPDEDTLRQMREHAAQVRLVSGERIGGGLAADGMGELSKLLLGAHPAKALRIARDTGVLVELIPEYGPAIGFDQESRYHARPLDEHHFEAVQAAADIGAPLAVRLAVLLHDLGKPASAWRGDDERLHYYESAEHGKRSHEEIGAQIASRVLTRLRYPTSLRDRVRRIVRRHMFWIPRRPDDGVKARRFLARNGNGLAFDLVAHKEADIRGKGRDADDELARLAVFRATLEREQSSPHRIRDLAIRGDDLIALGYRPGPALGRTLQTLLHDVVGDPSLNTREWLTAEARRLLEHA
jgi:tRNA nucleotidyltransferase/poly(A) polymerase